MCPGEGVRRMQVAVRQVTQVPWFRNQGRSAATTYDVAATTYDVAAIPAPYLHPLGDPGPKAPGLIAILRVHTHVLFRLVQELRTY